VHRVEWQLSQAGQHSSPTGPYSMSKSHICSQTAITAKQLQISASQADFLTGSQSTLPLHSLNSLLKFLTHAFFLYSNQLYDKLERKTMLEPGQNLSCRNFLDDLKPQWNI